MIDRLRGFLSPQTTEIPKDWEDSVVNSYRILRFQMQLVEKAKTAENFQEEEHSQRVRTRIGNLKDEVINAAGQEGSIFTYPQYIAVDPDKAYFYIPASNKLIKGKESIHTPNGLTFVPVLYEARDVDEKIWCLDKGLVERIAKELMALLPPKSFLRIVGQTA